MADGQIFLLAATLVLSLACGVVLGRWTRASEIRLLRERIDDAESGRGVGELITALDRRVAELDRKAEAADRGRIQADAAIREQIKAMSENNQSLLAETKRLTSTLSNTAHRGRYGEMQLDQLLHHSGLELDVHYRKQAKIDDGRIPDFTVLLPGGATLFIDAKFPFDNFWKAANTESPEERASLLASHVQDLIKHADALVERAYHDRESSPDFVVLFLPFESILSVALDVDSMLLERLFRKNVIPATPTTMLALLRTIGYGYSQRDMAENAAEIREHAVLLLKRTGDVHAKLERMGRQLRTVAATYGSLVQTAERSLFIPAQRMAALGVPSTKAITAIDTEIPLRDFQMLDTGHETWDEGNEGEEEYEVESEPIKEMP